MECKYYKNMNGVKGECVSQPPILLNGNWIYPMVEKGCECRFYKEPEPESSYQMVSEPEPAIEKPKPLTARQKALKAKREAEGK